MFPFKNLQIGQYVPDVKCIDHPEHIIVGFVRDVFVGWITIALGLTIALEKEIKNIFSNFYFM